MAEFKEVMKQYKRMCKSYPDCVDCPFKVELGWDCEPDALMEEEDMDIWETTVMEWARKHPEPKPVTVRDLLSYIAVHIDPDTCFSIDALLDKEIPKKLVEQFNLRVIKGEK